MDAYQEALTSLNTAQKQAVEAIDGPVLVIAGPGTGKTQLLSVRVAHILQQTDTLPSNILCLTFTESGAENMRRRLTRFIGQDAYSVGISTYHAFGGDLIRRFPEAFAETRLQAPADDLTKRQIVRGIVDGLAYDNPLKQLRHHLGDLIGTISEVKRALLSADALRQLAGENAAFIITASPLVQEAFSGVQRMPTKLEKSRPLFEVVLHGLAPLVPAAPASASFLPLAALAASQLETALAEADASGSTKPLTAWKTAWLEKNADNAFVIKGALETRRMLALADVFEQYEAALAEGGWYDFDDMILRAIEALEHTPELRYSLQEQYQYLLLDEFQDTNAAQLRLVQLLSDNPVHEGRPNVLAVGDDDQAIYAFQGAQYSNMLDFYQMYRGVLVVNLTENYRSSADILAAARAVAEQIEARLAGHFDLTKALHAANPALPPRADLARHEFLSDVAQYDWIARRIQQLVKQGTPPSEIAVLAPKHRQLEPLVPYLAALDVPMRYEKRENILEAPVVAQLITMSRLVLALHAHDDGLADALWPEVLSYPFWDIDVADLWRVSWQVQQTRRGGSAEDPPLSWAQACLEAGPAFRLPALLLLALASRAASATLEEMLDQLIGNEDVRTGTSHDDPLTPPDAHGSEHNDTETANSRGHAAATQQLYVRSPLRAFYTGKAVAARQPELFYDTVSHLTVLRARLRDHQAASGEVLRLEDLIRFVEMYEAAEERLLNTSPYNQQADAVQLMTVFKAKGLEFEHVFLPSLQDDIWGSSSRGNSNKLTLPPNLAPIRHAGATDDERLRIFFVAVTRAKRGLHLTSFARTYSGRETRRLKYLNEQEQPDGSVRALVLPEHAQVVQPNDHSAPTLESLELNWRQRHTGARTSASLAGLLGERLAQYQLSPTHLTHFLDVQYAGPEAFFFDTILRFPRAPSISSQFGSAIHETLEWVQHRLSETGELPPVQGALQYFAARLKRYALTPEQYALELARGQRALSMYLAQRGHSFKPTDKAEHNFGREGVFVADAHLSGKADRLEIDRTSRTITVIDYKTGRPHAKWTREARLHKYQLQLYCYKLLIEGSSSFEGYRVTGGRLEFVEPDLDGRIHALELAFNDAETTRVRRLLQAVWARIHALDFPDISRYSPDLKGLEAFEADLLDN